MTDVDKILEEIDKLNCYDKQRIFEKLGSEVADYDFTITVGDILSQYNIENLIESIGKDEVLETFSRRDLIDRLKELFLTADNVEELVDQLSDTERNELFESYDMVRKEDAEDEDEDKETYPNVDGLLEELAQYVVSPDDIIDYLNKIPAEVRKEVIIQAVMRWIS